MNISICLIGTDRIQKIWLILQEKDEAFFYQIFSKYILNMKVSPFSQRQTISYQREEIIPVSCCFGPLYTENGETMKQKPHNYRFHSQPKEPKVKKIDLVTPKRGFSTSKETNLYTQRSDSREKINQKAKIYQKNTSHPKLILTLGSKGSSQRTSRQTSKVSFNKDVNIGYQTGECKQSCLTTRNTTKPLNTQGNNLQNHENQTSFAFISEISFVEEEFISQDSETIQALNFIAQMKSAEGRQGGQQMGKMSFKKERGQKINYESQIVNPLSRITAQKGKTIESARKRLVL